MTLLKMVPRNHPQQVRKGRGDPERDKCYTPMSLFEPLRERHSFTVDACGCVRAPVSLAIGRWWDRDTDGLVQRWDGERVWCNPPHSDILPWVAKAWSSRCVAMLLLPANRCEQSWWQDLVEPFRDGLDGILRVSFVRARREFGTPEHPLGPPRSAKGKARGGVPFGLVTLLWPTPWRPDWSP